MAAHASFAKGQLLVAAQTFSVDEGRASDQLALCTFLRLEPGNGPFPKVPPRASAHIAPFWEAWPPRASAHIAPFWEARPCWPF